MKTVKGRSGPRFTPAQRARMRAGALRSLARQRIHRMLRVSWETTNELCRAVALEGLHRRTLDVAARQGMFVSEAWARASLLEGGDVVYAMAIQLQKLEAPQ